MKLHSSALLLLGVLALAACNNPNRYGAGAGGAGGYGAAGGAGGYGAYGGNAANDPNSPAYFSQTVGDMVHFAVDQSSISSQAATVLTGQAQWLNSHPQYTAIIEGHADEQGTQDYNVALGARRASSVQQFLIANGVAPQRLRTVSYGKERPLQVCSDESCYAQNRRAVTVISVGAGS